MPVFFAVNVDVAVADALFVFGLLSLPTEQFIAEKIINQNVAVTGFCFQCTKIVTFAAQSIYLPL